MKKPKSSQANETASSQVGDRAVPTEKRQTTTPNTAEEQTNSSQTTSAPSSKSKTTSKNSAKDKDFYTLSDRCENHIDFDPKAKDPSPEPHTKQVVRTSTNNVLSQQVPALIMCYLSKMLPVLASQLKSLFPENAHWFLVNPPYPKRLTGFISLRMCPEHGTLLITTCTLSLLPPITTSAQDCKSQMGDLSLISSMISWPATQSTPPSQPSSSNSEHLSPLRALLISEEQLAKYHYDGVIYILPLDVIFAINQFHQIRSQLEVEFKSRHKGEQVSLGTLWNYFFDEYIP